jgi:hypothetical protein
MEHIEIANDAVLRAQGLANDGMKSWYEQKLAEQKAAVASLQKGRKLVRISASSLLPRLMSSPEKALSCSWLPSDA